MGGQNKQPAAGLSTTWKLVVSENREHKAGVRKTRPDFSLLQPGRGKHEENTRVDPGSFTVAAGALPKPNSLDAFLETGKITHAPIKDKTDPITHFIHEGLDQTDRRRGVKNGYTTRAASQSWTWVQDPRVREKMELFVDTDPEHKGEQKYSQGADGVKHYNMWGAEDMVKAATKPYIKCEKPPRSSHIGFNDRKVLPWCYRDLEQKQNSNNTKPERSEQWESKRIWKCMRNEAYQKVLRGETPEPGQVAAFREYWVRRYKDEKLKESMKEESSEDEPMDLMLCRAGRDNPQELLVKGRCQPQKMRSARSLPPERCLRRATSPEGVPSPSSSYAASRGYSCARLSMPPEKIVRHEDVCRECSRKKPFLTQRSAEVEPSSMKAPMSSMAPQSVNRQDTLPRSTTAWGPVNRDTTPRGSDGQITRQKAG